MPQPRPLPTLPLIAVLSLLWPKTKTAQKTPPLDISLEDGLSNPGDDPLRIEITQDVIEPSEIALANFHDKNNAKTLAPSIQTVITDDLTNTDLFHAIPPNAHLKDRTDFETPVHWQS